VYVFPGWSKFTVHPISKGLLLRWFFATILSSNIKILFQNLVELEILSLNHWFLFFKLEKWRSYNLLKFVSIFSYHPLVKCLIFMYLVFFKLKKKGSCCPGRTMFVVLRLQNHLIYKMRPLITKLEWVWLF